MLAFIYHTGTRGVEAVRVEVRDLKDPRTDHPRLHAPCGKGGKDRFVPLSVTLVEQLRDWWRTHLLEEGVSLRLISQYLGHASLTFCARFTTMGI